MLGFLGRDVRFRPSIDFIGKSVFIICAIYIGGWIGHATAYTESKISLVWLPTGIETALLFRWGRRFWPAVYFGIVLVQLAGINSAPQACAIATTSTVGPLLAAWLLGRIAFSPTFDRGRDAVVLTFASLVGMLLTASGGVTWLWFFGIIPSAAIPSVWVVWWMGDLVGVLLAAPFLLALARETVERLIHNKIELLVFINLFALSWAIYYIPQAFGFPFFSMIFIIWASLRFGVLGSSLAVLTACLMATSATILGSGPFHSSSHELFNLWFYMGSSTIISLMITAIQTEGRRANAELEKSLIRLQGLTAELVISNDFAERNLREAEALRRTLDQNSIISITDSSGKITEVNDRFCQISGYARDELLGKDHLTLSSGIHPSSFWEELWSDLTAKRSWRNQICNRAKDGSLYWVDATIAPFLDSNGAVEKLVAISNDITARKRDEAALNVARLAADASNRAKTEFLANMSHEIRTPLTVILGYAEVLCNNPEIFQSPVARSRTLQSIQAAGQHLITILDDILDLSKIEADKLTIESMETELVGLLAEVERMVRPRAEAAHIALYSIFVTPLPLRVMCDPTRLRQILLNLLSNAVKFTRAGSVTMTSRVEEREHQNWLVIDIEDTGMGMSNEQTQRLFLKFSQADSTVTRKFGGTGLGLAISQRLARLMGGDVTLLWSEPGKGSCFRAELPFVEVLGSTRQNRSALPAKLSSIESANPIEPLGHILLVDDCPDTQKAIAFYLKSAGAIVEIAGNGKEALEMIDRPDQEANPYHLILTDMEMPEMDGYELSRTLRTRGCVLPIIALTAHATDEVQTRAKASGCDEFLTKPVRRKQLIEICRSWIGRKPTTPSVLSPA